MPKPGTAPTPEQVRKARGDLTQPEAAALVYVHWRTWQNWELGVNPMPAAKYELLCLKTKSK